MNKEKLKVGDKIEILVDRPLSSYTFPGQILTIKCFWGETGFTCEKDCNGYAWSFDLPHEGLHWKRYVDVPMCNTVALSDMEYDFILAIRNGKIAMPQIL